MLNDTLKELIAVIKQTSNELFLSVTDIRLDLTNVTNPALNTLVESAAQTYGYLYNNVGLIRGQLTLIDASNNMEQTSRAALDSINQIVEYTQETVVNTHNTVSALGDLEVSVSGAVVVTNNLLHPALNVVFEV